MGRWIGWLSSMLLLLSACGGSGGGGGSGSADTSSAPYGLDTRVAASGVRIPIGGGGTASVNAVDAFPGLGSLANPTGITHAGDGSNRLFVWQQTGVVSVISNRNTTPQLSTFLDIRSRVDASTGESGLLGLAFDPGFASNGYFYVQYVTMAGTRKTRISRFRVTSSGANTADPASERVVLESDTPNDIHFGGWLAFGPDNMLYASRGDGNNAAGVQDTSTLFGKILRLRVNADGSYTVPSDNPFGNLVWAYGFRNPWRCSFDRGTGDLWCGDVGQSSREEVDRVRRGENHGWPVYEGDLPYLNPTNRPYSDFTAPVHTYDHTAGVAIVGGYVYRGASVPGLVGRYLFSDYGSNSVWALSTDGSASLETATTSLGSAVLSFGEDEAGEIYAVSTGGRIFRFEAAGAGDVSEPMPATLSATGLFSDVATLTPAPGLIDFEVNSPLWSDGAQKRRWVVVPAGQTVDFAASGSWSFPVGTITVKHFELSRPGGGTTRVETRVMVHRTDGWTGFTYRWRNDQSDADLVTGAASGTYQAVNPATGATVGLTWTFPTQAQCMNCHTQASGRVLGLNTLQLNRNHSYAATGRSDNQLRTWAHIGLFSQDIGSASQYGAMPDPSDAAAPPGNRAKAYLDANCAMCHRPGGPTPVNMDLRYETSLADMRLVGVAAESPTVPGALRVAPGEHTASDLWRRVSSNDGAIRMPPLGRTLLDERALNLLATWIDGLQ